MEGERGRWTNKRAGRGREGQLFCFRRAAKHRLGRPQMNFMDTVVFLYPLPSTRLVLKGICPLRREGVGRECRSNVPIHKGEGRRGVKCTIPLPSKIEAAPKCPSSRTLDTPKLNWDPFRGIVNDNHQISHIPLPFFLASILTSDF